MGKPICQRGHAEILDRRAVEHQRPAAENLPHLVARQHTADGKHRHGDQPRQQRFAGHKRVRQIVNTVCKAARFCSGIRTIVPSTNANSIHIAERAPTTRTCTKFALPAVSVAAAACARCGLRRGGMTLDLVTPWRSVKSPAVEERSEDSPCSFRFQVWNVTDDTPSLRQNSAIDSPLLRCRSIRSRHCLCSCASSWAPATSVRRAATISAVCATTRSTPRSGREPPSPNGNGTCASIGAGVNGSVCSRTTA